MKNLEEIKNTTGLDVMLEDSDGFMGRVFPVIYKNGKVKVDNSVDQVLNFVFSWGGGFEHLSVSTPVKTPTWEQMCKMKDIFWNDDEVCMQLHPKKSEYVNTMKYCLHIWKPIDKEIPTPPSIFVGFREGKEDEDIKAVKKYLEEVKVEE